MKEVPGGLISGSGNPKTPPKVLPHILALPGFIGLARDGRKRFLRSDPSTICERIRQGGNGEPIT
jgi:hypothetical protein